MIAAESLGFHGMISQKIMDCDVKKDLSGEVHKFVNKKNKETIRCTCFCLQKQTIPLQKNLFIGHPQP